MSISKAVSANTIKPIETLWRGYRFRSRLEARWAVFFDTLGVLWEYEPEGFVLPSGRYYLPDFKIQEIGWFEIKPKTEEINLMDVYPKEGSLEDEFFNINEVRGGILYGTPGPIGDFCLKEGSYAGCVSWDSPYFFCECPECGSIGFEFDGRSARVKHKPNCSVPNIGCDKNYNSDSPRILAAAQRARSARFEYGESP